MIPPRALADHVQVPFVTGSNDPASTGVYDAVLATALHSSGYLSRLSVSSSDPRIIEKYLFASFCWQLSVR